MINTYENDTMEGTTTRLFKVSNIVGETYKRNMDNNIYMRNIVRNYGDQSNSRLLIIDESRKVLFDNYNSIVGDTLNNEEIKKGLSGLSSSNVYTLNGDEILQLSVPITYNTGNESNIIGSVLISHSLVELNNSLKELGATIIRISSISLIGALILTVFSDKYNRKTV